MGKDRIEVQSTRKERLYTKCFHDFLDCDLLTGEQKIIFLTLKRFLDVKKEGGEVYPTIETLQKMTKWGNKKVIKVIDSLIELGVIRKVQRGLNKPNLYLLSDKHSMWKCETLEDLKVTTTETKEEQYIRYLQAKGYVITKKEKESGLFANNTNTTNKPDSQTTYTKSKGQKEKSQDRPNKFHNFDQRNYDYDAIEKALLSRKTQK